jgi:AraC family ethanolamine operon transcriptional activator
MPVPTSPELHFDLHLTDLTEHARQLKLDIEMRQLDSGTPHARVAAVGTPRCVVMRVEYDRAYHQIGSTPPDALTIGIPDSSVDDFRWCNKHAAGDQIVNFSLENGFDGTCGAGFSGFAISIHQDLLHEAIESHELSIDFTRSLIVSEVLPNSEGLGRELRQQALAAFGGADFSMKSDVAEFFNFLAPALVVKYLAENKTPAAVPAFHVRRRAVRLALAYLNDADTLPLTVSELCSNIGVSSPTLFRAFQEQFGVGPKHYIQARRLCGVREQLFSSGNVGSITTVANDWGFWHMGQFAADYRRHFDELPSATLALANKVA